MSSLLRLLTLPHTVLRFLYRVFIDSYTHHGRFQHTISPPLVELLSLPAARPDNILLIEAPFTPRFYDFCSPNDVYNNVSSSCPYIPFEPAYTAYTRSSDAFGPLDTYALLLMALLPLVLVIATVLLVSRRASTAPTTVATDQVAAGILKRSELDEVILCNIDSYHAQNADINTIGGPFEVAPDLVLDVNFGPLRYAAVELEPEKDSVAEVDQILLNTVDPETSGESTVCPPDAVLERRSGVDVDEQLLPPDLRTLDVHDDTHVDITHTPLFASGTSMDIIEAAFAHADDSFEVSDGAISDIEHHLPTPSSSLSPALSHRELTESYVDVLAQSEVANHVTFALGTPIDDAEPLTAQEPAVVQVDEVDEARDVGSPLVYPLTPEDSDRSMDEIDASESVVASLAISPDEQTTIVDSQPAMEPLSLAGEAPFVEPAESSTLEPQEIVNLTTSHHDVLLDGQETNEMPDIEIEGVLPPSSVEHTESGIDNGRSEVATEPDLSVLSKTEVRDSVDVNDLLDDALTMPVTTAETDMPMDVPEPANSAHYEHDSPVPDAVESPELVSCAMEDSQFVLVATNDPDAQQPPSSPIADVPPPQDDDLPPTAETTVQPDTSVVQESEPTIHANASGDEPASAGITIDATLTSDVSETLDDEAAPVPTGSVDMVKVESVTPIVRPATPVIDSLVSADEQPEAEQGAQPCEVTSEADGSSDSITSPTLDDENALEPATLATEPSEPAPEIEVDQQTEGIAANVSPISEEPTVIPAAEQPVAIIAVERVEVLDIVENDAAHVPSPEPVADGESRVEDVTLVDLEPVADAVPLEQEEVAADTLSTEQVSGASESTPILVFDLMDNDRSDAGVELADDDIETSSLSTKLSAEATPTIENIALPSDVPSETDDASPVKEPISTTSSLESIVFVEDPTENTIDSDDTNSNDGISDADHDSSEESNSVTSFEPTTPEFEPAYTELPLRLARKLSLLSSPRSQFDEDEDDKARSLDQVVFDDAETEAQREKAGPAEKLTGAAELLYLIDECFKAGVQPEEVDEMLKIMERSPRPPPRPLPVPKDVVSEVEIGSGSAPVDGTADEEWDSVHLTASCKLATTA